MTRYAIPLLALSAIPVAFLAIRRFRELGPRTALIVRAAAVLPLLVSGTVHFLRPQMMLPVIPPPFPQANWFVMLTGLPELLGAGGLLVARARRSAAVCLAVYLIVIFPANVYIAGQTVGGIAMPGVLVRTLMQAGYMLLVLVAGWGLPQPRLLSRDQSAAASLTSSRRL